MAYGEAIELGVFDQLRTLVGELVPVSCEASLDAFPMNKYCAFNAKPPRRLRVTTRHYGLLTFSFIMCAYCATRVSSQKPIDIARYVIGDG